MAVTTHHVAFTFKCRFPEILTLFGQFDQMLFETLGGKMVLF